MKSLSTIHRHTAIQLYFIISIMSMSAQSYDKLSDYIWDVPRTGKQLFADPSPEATAMRHFQDYPISYATGTANVSIPLVKLPAGGATIALGLRYHTAAIKRNNAPTDVGLGWSMSGLGVISRQINGYPDEWTGDTAPYTWHNIKPISFCLDPINSWNWKYLQDIMTEYVDANYDVFSYAVPGYTGNFIIKCDTIKIGTEIFVNRTVKQLPDTDVRIDCHLSKSSGFNVYTFDLLTPEGVHYYFAEGERVTKTTDISPARYSFANSNYEAESVWHPVKIKDNKRECDTILITYRDGESWNYRENHTSTSQRLRVYKEYPSNSYIAGETVTRDVLNFSNTINSHQRRIPLAIKGRSGSIIFSGDKYTSSLMLKNANGDTIKNIILSNTDSHPDGSSIAYEYDAGGVRLSAMRCPSPDEIWKQTTRHIYTGSFEFDKDENSNIAVLSRINLPWGYMNAQGNIFSYVADYQGNIRAVVDSPGTAIQTTDYYPYGLPMATSTNPAANSYKYSGKELETDNGLTSYDFHARQYSPTINLFQSIDPKASTYPGLNPYLYCAANPIIFIDPTGEKIFYYDQHVNYEIKYGPDKTLTFFDKQNPIDAYDISLNAVILIESLRYLDSLLTGHELISYITGSNENINIRVSLTDDNRFYENGNIVWNPNKYHGGAHIDYNNGRLDNQRDPAIGLGHELAHAADWIVNGELNNNTWNYDSYNNTIYRVSFAEIKACNIENQIRQEAGIPRRLYYSYRISNGVIIPFANTAIPKISTNIYQKNYLTIHFRTK